MLIDGPRSASLLLLDTFNEEQLERALASAYAQLGGPATIVFAFLSPNWLPRLSEFLEITQIGLRCPRVVGGSAGGLVGDASEHENVAGCSLLALRLPGAAPSLEFWDNNLAVIPSGAAQSVSLGAVLIANPLHLPVDGFLAAWNARHPRLPAYGGFVSGGADADSLVIFTENGISSHGCIAVHFHGDVQLDGALGQACRPIGHPYLVTGAEGNLLTSLEGMAPMQCLEQAVLEESNRGNLTDTPKAGMLHTGFLVEESEQPATSPAGNTLIRAIIGGDPKSGAVAIAGTPEIGQEIQFQLRDADTASQLWREALEATKPRHDALPIAGLLFPCLGRGAEFFSQPDHDAGLVRDCLGGLPVAGLFVNGELASPTASLQAHTFSSVAVFFYPAATQVG